MKAPARPDCRSSTGLFCRYPDPGFLHELAPVIKEPGLQSLVNRSRSRPSFHHARVGDIHWRRAEGNLLRAGKQREAREQSQRGDNGRADVHAFSPCDTADRMGPEDRPLVYLVGPVHSSYICVLVYRWRRCCLSYEFEEASAGLVSKKEARGGDDNRTTTRPRDKGLHSCGKSKRNNIGVYHLFTP